MRIVFHGAASSELVEAAAWYDRRVRGLGTDLLAEVAAARAVIARDPETWPRWATVRGEVVRRFLVARFPYAIPFVIRGQHVIVLAVAHAKRKPGYWRDRLR